MAIAFDSSGATKLTASVTSATVDITAAAAGAWVYCLVAIGANETSTTFTGWTLVNSLEANESTATHYALYRRLKVAGDTTFTLSWSATSTRATIGWASYTGADGTTPDELAAVTLHTTGTSFASPSLTPTAGNRWALFCCYARDTTAAADMPDGSAWTPDTSIPLTERLDASNSASASNPWMSLEFADSNGAVTQAAHSGTATCATAENHGAAFLLYLIPAAAASAAVLPVPYPQTPRARPAPRARLGARAALAAGILATGIGPPAVPAPHQPPAVAHPAPHRATWRGIQGRAPNVPQQSRVPPRLAQRIPHRAAWRAGTGQPPGAVPLPRRPVTVFTRRLSRAVWRSVTGAPPLVTGVAVRAPQLIPQPRHLPPGRARYGGVLGAANAPPPPFSIGALTAADKAAAQLTAVTTGSTLTAPSAPLATLTGSDKRTGGPG